MEQMADRIKRLRLQHGLTQEELGNIIGVQKSAIRKYESGAVQNIKRTSIKKLADYFGVSPSYLLGYEDKEPEIEARNPVYDSERNFKMESTFQKRLLEAMQLRNVKAVDLAKMSGLSTAQISQYVNGQHEARQIALHKLAVALCVSESWLMGCEVSIKGRDVQPEGKKPVTESDLKVALFGKDSEVTDEMWDKVKEYADYIKNKYGK